MDTQIVIDLTTLGANIATIIGVNISQMRSMLLDRHHKDRSVVAALLQRTCQHLDENQITYNAVTATLDIARKQVLQHLADEIEAFDQDGKLLAGVVEDLKKIEGTGQGQSDPSAAHTTLIKTRKSLQRKITRHRAHIKQFGSEVEYIEQQEQRQQQLALQMQYVLRDLAEIASAIEAKYGH